MAEQPPQSTLNYGAAPPDQNLPKGMAIASLILGIISVVTVCIPYVALVLGVVAIILGAIARSKANAGTAGGKGMATVGLILGIVGIILVVIVVAAGVAFISWAKDKSPEEIQQMLQPNTGGGIRTPSAPDDSTSMFEPIRVYARAWLA